MVKYKPSLPLLPIGTKESNGTKLLSISGDVAKPGIYEIEWGITINELLQLCQATSPHFIQISGPSGICINNSEFNRKICKEDLICGGSIMIFNNLLNFINNSSTASFENEFPEGLFGEHKNKIFEFSLAAFKISSTFGSKDSFRNTSFSSILLIFANTLYIPYVGGNVITLSCFGSQKAL